MRLVRYKYERGGHCRSSNPLSHGIVLIRFIQRQACSEPVDVLSVRRIPGRWIEVRSPILTSEMENFT